MGRMTVNLREQAQKQRDEAVRHASAYKTVVAALAKRAGAPVELSKAELEEVLNSRGAKLLMRDLPDGGLRVEWKP